MTYFGMYMLTKLDNFRCFFDRVTGIFMVLFVLLSAFTVFYAACRADNEYNKTFLEHFKEILQATRLHLLFAIMIVSMFITTLIPTTKQAAFIYIAPQIIENGAVKDTVKNIPELTKLGTDYLKELLKEKVQDVEQW